MSVIFCDNACDLWKDQVQELDVKVLHFPYALDGVEQEKRIENPEDYDEFFEKIKAGVMPSTALINSYIFAEAFDRYLAEGHDILYIHLSSKLTGTFDYLPGVVEELKLKYPERKIYVVDSLHATMAIGLLVYRASKLLKAGKTLPQIVEEIEKLKTKISCYFAVNDLFHLKRNGRISTMQVIGGTLLGVKPILKISEAGKVIKILNVKGKRNVIKQLLYYLETFGENAADFPIVIMHSLNEEDAKELKEQVQQLVGTEANIWIQPIGPIIGTHCGPGTLAIVFRSKAK